MKYSANKETKSWVFSQPRLGGVLIASIMATLLLASPLAAKQNTNKADGTLTSRLYKWPSSYNALTSSDGYIRWVAGFVHASLLNESQETNEVIPYLAHKWESSEDLTTFTFELNKKATFGSGNPVTAEDVKFTFDLIYDRARCLLCESTRNSLGPMKKVEAVNQHKVIIQLANTHFYNLRKLGSIPIIEKKMFASGDFNKDFNKTIKGAGPYLFDEKGTVYKSKFVLTRRDDFWLDSAPYYKDRYHFKKLVFKLLPDATAAFEAFKRGDLDYFYFDNDAIKFWDSKQSKIFKNPNVVKFEFMRTRPYLYDHILFNMREGVGKDKEFRQAISHLVNRDVILKKIYNSHYKGIAGPFPPGSPYSAQLTTLEYNPKKAVELLKQAGYTQVGSDGILYKTVQDKDGKEKVQRASLQILHWKTAYEPWLTILIEDAKKVGVEIKQRILELSSVVKNMDEHKFSAVSFAWVTDIIPLPRQLWHSEGANKQGSSNYGGLADPSLDKLIEQATATKDEKKRISLFHEIEKKIVSHFPYVFLWSQKSHLVVYWKNKLDPTKTPTYQFSGDYMTHPFYLHWRSVSKKVEQKKKDTP
ncbi:MAG: ABC transporter substrate-binding protein [Proteobacteria bacterium]|nr:ABC transporter substrate-binding protein [Pseudomonadota bacterium]